MATEEPGLFASADETERKRLSRLFQGLREKLLDLTKRNRMLNYTLGARSKRHLQIVDEVPEEVYRLLVEGNAGLELVSLAEPDDIPKDEKTEEFIATLEHAKVSDIEYLTRLQALENTGRDDDASLMAAERELRDRLRVKLNMPARAKRSEINRIEHARTCGVDPNLELPKIANKKSHRDKKLQTLKYPDELEAVMSKISDDARLAEQEMGLSTLFLAFGFLEWYETELSDKAHFAPLLLLPAKLERRTVYGKRVFDIHAGANSVEANLSLQKFLEREFGRTLPDFEHDDEESAGSVESYFKEVESSVERLPRWRIRRWIVLGHFAFGRLAMYADLEPEKWRHPVGESIVQAVLTGTEQGDDRPLASSPEDYSIDDPKIEKAAPFLIQDADASQHSALVDVAKEANLVIQGPPGTGKSQTITNIVANAIASGKTVLFLSEKRAALQVVKRRLDRAKLGEFCLEVHSDKSSSKEIVASIKRRLDLGLSAPRFSTGQFADATWLESRKIITNYLSALHEPAGDGRTPFSLMWNSIRGRSVFNDLAALFQNCDFFASGAEKMTPAIDQIEIYAETVKSFSDAHGYPTESVWADLKGVDSLQAYEINDFIKALEDLQAPAKYLAAVGRENNDLIASDFEELKVIAGEYLALVDVPDSELLHSVVAMNLTEVTKAIGLLEELAATTDELRTKQTALTPPIEVLSRAIALTEVRKLPPEYLNLTPRQAFDRFNQATEDLRLVLGALEGLLPPLQILGFDSSATTDILDATTTAIIVSSKIQTEWRPWLAVFRPVDDKFIEATRKKWTDLCAAEKAWRALCGAKSSWPKSSDIRAAGDVYSKGAMGSLVAKISGARNSAKDLVDRLEFNELPVTAKVLVALAAYVQLLEQFLSDPEIKEKLGRAWSGLETPFDQIVPAIKVRAFLADRLTTLPNGQAVLG
ncbi:MAG: DUF4011 domain-containing protein, partial [Xanthobacteraceae bacterium]